MLESAPLVRVGPAPTGLRRFAVNYLAGLLTLLLLPLVKNSAPARIVNVSPGGQEPIDFVRRHADPRL
jgi:hypothetical protein